MLFNALIFISGAITYLRSRLKFPYSVDQILEGKKCEERETIKSHIFMVVRFFFFFQIGMAVSELVLYVS